jgi:hypothetical protein
MALSTWLVWCLICDLVCGLAFAGCFRWDCGFRWRLAFGTEGRSLACILSAGGFSDGNGNVISRRMAWVDNGSGLLPLKGAVRRLNVLVAE